MFPGWNWTVYLSLWQNKIYHQINFMVARARYLTFLQTLKNQSRNVWCQIMFFHCICTFINVRVDDTARKLSSINFRRANVHLIRIMHELSAPRKSPCCRCHLFALTTPRDHNRWRLVPKSTVQTCVFEYNSLQSTCFSNKFITVL